MALVLFGGTLLLMAQVRAEGRRAAARLDQLTILAGPSSRFAPEGDRSGPLGNGDVPDVDVPVVVVDVSEPEGTGPPSGAPAPDPSTSAEAKP